MARALTIGSIDTLLREAGIARWGVAANDPALPAAPPLPTAISLLARVTDDELAGVEDGPTPAYYAGYRRVNSLLDAAASALADGLAQSGSRAQPVLATIPEEQYATIDDWCAVPVFPHKTAATRAGLGWIGKTALFVSPDFGPRVRLATVFTDMALPAGEPIGTGRCGACRRCVDACPAGAGVDVTWRAGMPRAELFDARACEHETEKYDDLGGVCGVCIAVCPWGLGQG
jgi:epoxyqueuosine reductase